MVRRGYLNVRLDESLMTEVHAIFSTLGISTGDALTLIYNQVKLHRGFPFELKVPTDHTIEAMREGEQPEKLKAYKDFSAVRQELGL
jgi:DNA-damage-inducible protein J